MNTLKYNVFGLGNAIVDIIAFVSEDFLHETGLSHGSMTLTDTKKQGEILALLQNHNLELRAGGSASNTIWTLMLCGAKVSYTGKFSNDPNGFFFAKEFRDNGITIGAQVAPYEEGPTATCIVLTTPDTQRTMSTHLGVSTQLSQSDIDFDLVERSVYFYCEGYLLADSKNREACFAVAEFAKKKNIKIALSFSDTFITENFREHCLEFSRLYADVTFCNMQEMNSLLETPIDSKKLIEKNLAHLAELVPRAFVTHSDDGCWIVENKEYRHVHGEKVKAIDSNGAGDAFAGGALYILSQEKDKDDVIKAGTLGNKMGAAVVQVHGARIPKEKINKLLNEIKR